LAWVMHWSDDPVVFVHTNSTKRSGAVRVCVCGEKERKCVRVGKCVCV